MRILPADQFDIQAFKTTPIQAGNEIEARVDAIIENVRKNGDQALIEYAKMFDKAEIDSLLVSQQEIDEAFAACSPALIETITKAKENIRSFHANQKRTSFTVSEQAGIMLGQRVIPLGRVGIYVPGGTASYPSTVLMNAIPPSIAGVSEIVMTTPPGKDGKIAPAILCAAKIAGVTKIVKARSRSRQSTRSWARAMCM